MQRKVGVAAVGDGLPEAGVGALLRCCLALSLGDEPVNSRSG